MPTSKLLSARHEREYRDKINRQTLIYNNAAHIRRSASVEEEEKSLIGISGQKSRLLLTLFLPLKKGRRFTTPHKHGEKKRKKERKKESFVF